MRFVHRSDKGNSATSVRLLSHKTIEVVLNLWLQSLSRVKFKLESGNKTVFEVEALQGVETLT